MHPRKVEGIRQEDLPEDESVLVDPARERALVLNAIGTIVWELCDGSRTVASMAALIAQQVPGHDVQAIHKDVEAFVAKLVEEGFVQAGFVQS